MNSIGYKWLAIAAVSVASFLTSTTAAAKLQEVNDIVGRKVTVDIPAKRIVVGFYFEEIMAVGTENIYDSVVGISRYAWEGWIPENWNMYASHRPSLKNITDIGEAEVQSFSVEKVLSLKPDLIILAEWQMKALGSDFKRLEDSGIPVVVIDYNQQTVKNHVASTKIIGKITGQEKRAEEIADMYEHALNDIARRVSLAHKEKPRVYAEFGNKGPEEYSFTYGKNMWGAIITEAGGQNISAPFVEWWGMINPEQLLVSNPEYVFISGREKNKVASALPMGVGENVENSRRKLFAFSKRPGWENIDAVKNHHIYGVYQGGSRTLSDFAFVQYIAKTLYPEQFSDIDPMKNYLSYYEKYLPVKPSGVFAISAY